MILLHMRDSHGVFGDSDRGIKGYKGLCDGIPFITLTLAGVFLDEIGGNEMRITFHRKEIMKVEAVAYIEVVF